MERAQRRKKEEHALKVREAESAKKQAEAKKAAMRHSEMDLVLQEKDMLLAQLTLLLRQYKEKLAAVHAQMTDPTVEALPNRPTSRSPSPVLHGGRRVGGPWLCLTAWRIVSVRRVVGSEV